jgi:hypothetical protein
MASNFDNLVFTGLWERKAILVLRGYKGSIS